jgi:hypothetical protein
MSTNCKLYDVIAHFRMVCLLQQKTIHEHKLMLEENNPRDFMDVFLLQMEAKNVDENSIFTGSYKSRLLGYIHYGITVPPQGLGLFSGSYEPCFWAGSFSYCMEPKI